MEKKELAKIKRFLPFQSFKLHPEAALEGADRDMHWSVSKHTFMGKKTLNFVEFCYVFFSISAETRKKA